MVDPRALPARRDQMWLLWVRCGQRNGPELLVGPNDRLDLPLRADVVDGLVASFLARESHPDPTPTSGTPSDALQVVLRRPGSGAVRDEDLSWAAATLWALAARGLTGSFEVETSHRRSRGGLSRAGTPPRPVEERPR